MGCITSSAADSPSAGSGGATKRGSRASKTGTLPRQSSQLEDDYTLGAVLGRGHYGWVYRGTCKRTGRVVAVKVIDKSRSRPARLQLEVDILRRIKRHPNVVQLFEVYHTEKHVNLVLEFMAGGELFERLVDKGPLTEREAATMTRKLASALRYLHKKGIVHRDLKPENILLVDKSHGADVKLADFGLSRMYDPAHELMKTVCGTWAYSAPEVRVGKRNGYNHKADMWSLGVILYVALSGYHPFDPDGNAPENELQQAIKEGRYDFIDPVWEEVSEGAKNLIRALIVVDSDVRLDSNEVLLNSWVKRYTPRLHAKNRSSDHRASGGAFYSTSNSVYGSQSHVASTPRGAHSVASAPSAYSSDSSEEKAARSRRLRANSVGSGLSSSHRRRSKRRLFVKAAGSASTMQTSMPGVVNTDGEHAGAGSDSDSGAEGLLSPQSAGGKPRRRRKGKGKGRGRSRGKEKDNAGVRPSERTPGHMGDTGGDSKAEPGDDDEATEMEQRKPRRRRRRRDSVRSKASLMRHHHRHDGSGETTYTASTTSTANRARVIQNIINDHAGAGSGAGAGAESEADKQARAKAKAERAEAAAKAKAKQRKAAAKARHRQRLRDEAAAKAAAEEETRRLMEMDSGEVLEGGAGVSAVALAPRAASPGPRRPDKAKATGTIHRPLASVDPKARRRRHKGHGALAHMKSGEVEEDSAAAIVDEELRAQEAARHADASQRGILDDMKEGEVMTEDLSAFNDEPALPAAPLEGAMAGMVSGEEVAEEQAEDIDADLIEQELYNQQMIASGNVGYLQAMVSGEEIAETLSDDDDVEGMQPEEAPLSGYMAAMDSGELLTEDMEVEDPLAQNAYSRAGAVLSAKPSKALMQMDSGEIVDADAEQGRMVDLRHVPHAYSRVNNTFSNHARNVVTMHKALNRMASGEVHEGHLVKRA